MLPGYTVPKTFAPHGLGFVEGLDVPLQHSYNLELNRV